MFWKLYNRAWNLGFDVFVIAAKVTHRALTLMDDVTDAVKDRG